MLIKNSAVIYKNLAACVISENDGKYQIEFYQEKNGKKQKAQQNVRLKDIAVLSEKPCTSLEKLVSEKESLSPGEEEMYALDSKNELSLKIKETHELLLSDSETENAPLSFDELASIFYGDFTPDLSFALYSAL